MLRLFLKVFVFLCIILFICNGVLLLNPKYEYDYLSSIKNKLSKLERTKNRKIVIIGGSNVNFGINSDQMEDELFIPVINTGLHAELGPKFWFEYVRKELNSEDILIVSPEYKTLNKDMWYGMNGNSVPKTILYTPEKLPILLNDYTLFKKTTNGVFRTLKSYWEAYPFDSLKDTYGPYDIRAFNDDNLKDEFLNFDFKEKVSKETIVFDRTNMELDQLIEYNEYFTNKNVDVFIAPPAMLDESVRKETAIAFLDSLNRLTRIPVLNKYSNYFFRRSLMNDTKYHLNREGRKLRTNLLIKEINSITRNSKILPSQKIFLSTDDSKVLNLQEMKDKYNTDIEFTHNNTLVVKPISSDKVGFVRYKLEPLDYSSKQFKAIVRTSEQVIRNLYFRSVNPLKFDYIKPLGDNTYSLCKDLSNVKTTSKTNHGFIGVGFNKQTLGLKDQFEILHTELTDNHNDCETSLNVQGQSYSIKSSDFSLIFRVNSIDDKEVSLNKITNISHDIEIKNQEKYFLRFENNQIVLNNFYTQKELMRQQFRDPIKFTCSGNNSIELVIKRYGR